MNELRFAQGTLDEAQFERAAAKFSRMDAKNKAVARAFLVAPGKHQIVIAQEHDMKRQLVHKQCKRIFDSHCKLTKLTRDKSE